MTKVNQMNTQLLVMAGKGSSELCMHMVKNIVGMQYGCEIQMSAQTSLHVRFGKLWWAINRDFCFAMNISTSSTSSFFGWGGGGGGDNTSLLHQAGGCAEVAKVMLQQENEST